MSIAHQAYLDTTESAEQIAARVARIFKEKGLRSDSPDAGQFLEDGGVPTNLGMFIEISTPEPMPFDVIEEGFGVSSTVHIWFQPDKEIPMNPQLDEIAVLMVALLEEISGDAAITLHSEIGWLIRRNGEIILHEDSELWPEHRLALINTPYRRESHHL
ncbi:SitI3 family protein [Kitasatospora cineracea]